MTEKITYLGPNPVHIAQDRQLADEFVADQLAGLTRVVPNRPRLQQAIADTVTKPVPQEKPILTLTKLQYATVIEAQVNKQLERFKAEYNKRNTASYVDFKVNILGEGTRELMRTLVITMTLDGVSSVLFSTKYGFPHPKAIEDEGEWKLTMWNEALYSLIGGGIAFGMEIAKQRKTETHG